MDSKLIKKFKKDGFIVYDLKEKNILRQLRNRFLSTFDKTSKINLNKSINDDQHIIDLYNSKNRKYWTGVYDIIKLDPLLYKLASSNELLTTAKKLSLKDPSFGTRPQVRVDMPNDEKFSFKSHQDYPFNLGSKNSIVAWIPLQTVTKENGAIQIARSSHKNFKTYLYGKNNKFNIDIGKNVKKKIIDKNHYKLSLDDKKFNFESIKLKFGQVLIFSQFLVHKSGENTSNRIRFSVQLRYTDLSDKDYAKRNYFLFLR
jgi:phytanoyl-CoA hydroxylase